MNSENLKHANWTTIAEIENTGKISCIDGRHDHCIVGAPGGNIGEVILLLAATERLNGTTFTQSQIQQILANYASSFGRFYKHTDAHAVARLLLSLEHDPELSPWAKSFNGDLKKFFDALTHLDKHKADNALPYLLMPSNVGCGHLALLIQQAEQYQVRKQLVLDTMTSFFQLMWLGNKRMQFEMLEGLHAEKEVVVIDSDHELENSSAIPFACHTHNEQRFVTHSAARRFFHRRDAQFINQYLSFAGMDSLDNQQLIDEVERLSELQLSNTIKALAKHLPIVHVVISNDNTETQ